MTKDFTTEKTIAAPSTVGDFIKFLQQFPEDYVLDLYREETDCYGSTSAACAYELKVQALANAKSLELTV